jgi:hypothetical protein
MLIACPECAHEVSDRAAACPRCGFPIATHVAEQRAAEAATPERTTRRVTGDETDCPPCEGRGFRMLEHTDEKGAKKQGFGWCIACNESGRLPVVHSSGGYWSVSIEHVEAFVRGALPTDSPHVTAFGSEPPPPPSYPAKEPAKGGGSSHS